MEFPLLVWRRDLRALWGFSLISDVWVRFSPRPPVLRRLQAEGLEGGSSFPVLFYRLRQPAPSSPGSSVAGSVLSEVHTLIMYLFF